MRLWVVLAALTCAYRVGCDCGGPAPRMRDCPADDADAAVPDAGDAGAAADAGTPDAGATDSGATDAGNGFPLPPTQGPVTFAKLAATDDGHFFALTVTSAGAIRVDQAGSGGWEASRTLLAGAGTQADIAASVSMIACAYDPVAALLYEVHGADGGMTIPAVIGSDGHDAGSCAALSRRDGTDVVAFGIPGTVAHGFVRPAGGTGFQSTVLFPGNPPIDAVALIGTRGDTWAEARHSTFGGMLAPLEGTNWHPPDGYANGNVYHSAKCTPTTLLAAGEGTNADGGGLMSIGIFEDDGGVGSLSATVMLQGDWALVGDDASSAWVVDVGGAGQWETATAAGYGAPHSLAFSAAPSSWAVAPMPLGAVAWLVHVESSGLYLRWLQTTPATPVQLVPAAPGLVVWSAAANASGELGILYGTSQGIWLLVLPASAG